ncbi:MAG: lycopene cyclase family protein [Chloroflexi bacterium]|nr:lycopene cyclase family protein [Chloroflexota bacterium]
MHDVLIVGSGPAGVGLAAACGAAGLDVAVLTPDETLPWRNTYGVWLDELDDPALLATLGQRWDDVRVIAGGATIALGRGYGWFDNDALQRELHRRADESQVIWYRGNAARVEPVGGGARVVTQEGPSFAARVVIDATGHQPALLRRPLGPRVAWQAAYGVVGHLRGAPVPAGAAVFMDYRPAEGPRGGRERAPTFLYAMDLGDGRYFVEETSLAAAPALGFDVLQQRLELRLAQAGATIDAIGDVERCLFPMNGGIPERDGCVIGFGAAAGMVHPASGFLVGAALRRAPRVARVLAAVLEAGVSAEQAAGAAWQAVWPPDQRRRLALYEFGLAALLRMNQATLGAFFAAFFRLPPARWHAFLSDRGTAPGVAGTMLRLFLMAPPGVKLVLLLTAFREWPLLLRAVRGT